MKCPHCLVEVHDIPYSIDIGNDKDGSWYIISQKCANPLCQKNVYHLQQIKYFNGVPKVISNRLVRPNAISRTPVSIEVPVEYAGDYNEACLVLADSPKASAALSRRCLQSILRNKLGITKKDLSQEIQEVIDKALLPTDLLESIDAIRNTGNFAAHPIKSQSTGEIVDVEPHEAEWNLDVLEMLFEFLFVRPAAIQRKRDALNIKLADLGKPSMK